MRKTALAALVVIVAIGSIALASGISWAVGGMGTPEGAALNPVSAPRDPGGPYETFYVVAYHWGWGVFKGDGAELDKIRVKEGTAVEIYAVNEHAREAIEKLPAPVAKAVMAINWQKRTIEAVEKGLIPAPEGMTIEQALGMGHVDIGGGHGHDEEMGEGEDHDDADDGHDEEMGEGQGQDDAVDGHDEDMSEGQAHDDADDGHGHDEEMGEGQGQDDAVGGHDEEMRGDQDHEDADDGHDEETGGDNQGGMDAMPAEPLWPYMGDHGFLIHQYGVVEYLEADADEPVRVAFLADVSGAQQFICTNYCGYGHKYQPQPMLVVE